MVGMGRWKKRRPSCNEADKGCSMVPRENGLTSIGSFFTRRFGETAKKAKQMTTELSKTVGAAFHGKRASARKCVS